MIAKVKAFHRPSDLEAVCTLLKEKQGVAVPLAGGTDLLVHQPGDWQEVVSLKGLGLDTMSEDGDFVVIGACVSLQQLVDDKVILSLGGGILSAAALSVYSRNVRNQATIGGNLAAALPSADLPPTLIALGASYAIVGPAGSTRTITADKFATGNRSTCLQAGEILKEIRIKKSTNQLQGYFNKLGRTKSDIALVNVAACASVEKGVWSDLKLAVGSCAPTPIFLAKLCIQLEGQPVDAGGIRAACKNVEAQLSPKTDVRASADYRRMTARVLVRRALENLAGLKEGEAR